jgi:hypothetical protein
MTRSELRTGVLVGLLVAVLAAYVVPKLEWAEETKRVGASGEAADDPDYAARLLVGALGYRAVKIDDPAKLADLPPNATLHIGSIIAEPLAARLEPRIIEWVRRGGHLVIAVAGPEQSDRFTNALGMHRIGRHHAVKEEQIELEGRKLSVRLSDCDVFKLDAKPIWSATVPTWFAYSRFEAIEREQDDERDGKPAPEQSRPVIKEERTPALAIARWPFGKGLVTAVCDDRPLSNGWIGRFDHAEFVARVLIDGRDGPIYFAPETEYPSLLPWLYAHAPEAIAGAVLLILLALWRAIPRFGAIRREAPPQRPGLSIHLRAVGLFHLGRGDWHTLLTSLREEVRRLARQTGSPLELAEIAGRAGLAAAPFEAAMADTPVRDRREFVRTAAMLSHAIDVLQAHRPTPPRKPFQKKTAI